MTRVDHCTYPREDESMRLWKGLACAVTLAGLAWSNPANAELKVGDLAPDVEFQGSDGKAYKLSQFRGKQAVVIAWFPKAFTGG